MLPLESAVVVPTGSPLNKIVVKPLNPPPLTATDAPAAPEVGVNDIFTTNGVGVPPTEVAVKVADAVSIPSEAVTVLLASVDDGTVNEPDIVPSEPAVVVSIVWPLNEMVVEPLKPFPLTATDVPTGPEVGLNDMLADCAFAIGANDVNEVSALRTNNASTTATKACLKPI